jgi:hypothetical protein
MAKKATEISEPEMLALCQDWEGFQKKIKALNAEKNALKDRIRPLLGGAKRAYITHEGIREFLVVCRQVDESYSRCVRKAHEEFAVSRVVAKEKSGQTKGK